MKKMVKDPELAKKLIPTYPIGCKRITPSDTYLKVNKQKFQINKYGTVDS